MLFSAVNCLHDFFFELIEIRYNSSIEVDQLSVQIVYNIDFDRFFCK